jgi:adenylate cyclase
VSRGSARKLAAGLALGAASASLVLLLVRMTPARALFDTAELKSYDWRIRRSARPAAVDKNIALVGISDTTIRDLEPLFGHWPWPRVALSYVIDFLARAPAKLIAVDIAFTERDRVERYDIGGGAWTGSGAESDAALAASVKKAGNVIMLADAVGNGLADENRPSGDQQQETSRRQTPDGPPYAVTSVAEPRPVILPPFPDLAAASLALGHNFLALDPDGPARRIVPFVEHDSTVLPSLGMAVALQASGTGPRTVSSNGADLMLGSTRVPLVPVTVRDASEGATPAAPLTHTQWTLMIDYKAPAILANGNTPYESYELRHLFESEQQILAGVPPHIDPSRFRDKIVFIGFTASGLRDVFNTPFGEGTMSGIQLHASVVDSVLSKKFIRPASGLSTVVAAFAIAAGVGLISTLLPLWLALLTSAAVLTAWVWLAAAAFTDGVWVNLTQPLAAGGLALFGGTTYQYFVEGREKRKVKRLFGRYVSRDVYAQLLAHPELAELGGNRRDMSVLFSDIRGFTTVTERGNPEEIVAQLNEYFSKMVEVVFRHHGTVDKFVGDMVMALFGAPVDDEQHAEHAVQAAIAMVGELGALNRRWASAGMAQLDIGIGVNSGEMIAGNIGSASIMSYTVIGDNVNLGSRLESLNKEYKTRVIISDATRTRLTGTYDLRPLGDVVVKGKSKPVAIYALSVPAPLERAERGARAPASDELGGLQGARPPIEEEQSL